MHFESSWNYLSGNSSRGGYFHCGRGGRRGGRNGRVSIHCQICNKYGHTTSICYHRLNPTYVAQPYNFYPHSNPAQLYNSHQNFFPKNVSAMVFSFFCTTSVFASHQFSAPPQFCTAAVSNPLPQAYATQSVPTQQTQNWFIDSSASHHITTDATNLVEDVSTQEDENVFLGNVCQSCYGSASFPSSTNPYITLYLKSLLHVPSINKNLVSISKFAKDNSVCIF